jgi:hypothetical protein
MAIGYSPVNLTRRDHPPQRPCCAIPNIIFVQPGHLSRARKRALDDSKAKAIPVRTLPCTAAKS